MTNQFEQRPAEIIETQASAVSGAERDEIAAPADTGARRRGAIADASLYVQRRATEAGPAHAAADVSERATEGVAGPGAALPHGDAIQRSFGAHDLSGVRAHVGGDAAASAADIGAVAYATGSDVAFAAPPDLHTAAHEAAHVVQQRGDAPKGGVGEVGDRHERHADQVADAVVRGESAAPLLDGAASPTAAETTAGAAVQLSPAPGAATADDWDPRGPKANRPKPNAFRGVALTRPADEAQVTLGSKHTQTYWIANTDLAPKGMSYEWRHSLKGAAAHGDEILSGERRVGETNELELKPRVPGTKRIKSQLVQTGPGGKSSLDVEDVVITTPKPKMIGAPVLESVSADGNRRPVLDTLAFGEDLLVTVQLDLISDDASDVKGKLESGNMAYKSAKQVRPGEYEIRIHPSRVGKVNGSLRVLPVEMITADVPAINLALNVEDVKNPDDPGSRPQNVDGVKDWLLAPIEEIYKRRHDGISNVYDQEKEKDPPPKTPLWKTLLKTAVTIAINSVTAGLGAKIANSIIAGADDKHFTTELVKVLFEQSMSAGAQTAVEAAFDGGGGSGPGGGGRVNPDKPKRALGIMFRDAQWAGLGQEAINAKQRDLTTIENMVKRKEAEKPGAGFREALKLDAALKQSYETAETEQYIHTFQRWCSVLATNSINTEEGDGATTNLGKVVDVDRIVEMPGERGHPNKTMPGMETKPGVLNLELEDNERITHSMGDHESHPLKVAKATIGGLASQDFRATIKHTPISQLELPIVATYRSDHNRRGARIREGFVIGRNEASQYWASEQGESLSVLAAARMSRRGTVDPVEAAKFIIAQEIGSQTVEPKEA